MVANHVGPLAVADLRSNAETDIVIGQSLPSSEGGVIFSDTALLVPIVIYHLSTFREDLTDRSAVEGGSSA